MSGVLPRFATLEDAERWLAEAGEDEAHRLLANDRASSDHGLDERSRGLLMLALKHRELQRRSAIVCAVIAAVAAAILAALIIAIRHKFAG